MAQHMLIGMYAPLAFVLAAPVTLLLRTLPAARGQHQCNGWVGDQAGGRAAQHGGQLPSPGRGQGAQQESDGGGQHERERGVHADEHVLGHVASEVLVGEGRHGRQQRDGEQDGPGQEPSGPPPAPALGGVAATGPAYKQEVGAGNGQQNECGQQPLKAAARIVPGIAHVVVHQARRASRLVGALGSKGRPLRWRR